MIIKSYVFEKDQDFDENILLFYGENIGLIDDIKSKIKKKFNECQIVLLSQENLLEKKEDFYNNYYNLSLFDKKKVFIIDNCNDKIINVLEQIIIKNTEQKVFLFANLLDKKSKLRNKFEKSKTLISIPCYPDDKITLKNIILERLKNFKGLTTQNLNLIIENCNLNRSKLNNELEKIISYFKSKIIDLNNLEKLLNIKENENFNELRDEAIAGNKNNTNKLLDNTFFSIDKNVFYLSAINLRLNKIKDAMILARGKSVETAINQLKPPVFWKDKPIYINQISKWNIQKINKALTKTFEVEKDLKSNSNINKILLVKKLLLDICLLANAA